MSSAGTAHNKQKCLCLQEPELLTTLHEMASSSCAVAVPPEWRAETALPPAAPRDSRAHQGHQSFPLEFQNILSWKGPTKITDSNS